MLSIDATFIFIFISFVIFVFLMKLICYKPILKVISERQKFYEKNKKTVFETSEKTQNILNHVADEISKTKLASSQLLKKTADENEFKKQKNISDKKEEIQTSIQEYKNNLEQDIADVRTNLKSEVENYAREALSSILKIDKSEVSIDNSKINEILK